MIFEKIKKILSSLSLTLGIIISLVTLYEGRNGCVMDTIGNMELIFDGIPFVTNQD